MGTNTKKDKARWLVEAITASVAKLQAEVDRGLESWTSLYDDADALGEDANMLIELALDQCNAEEEAARAKLALSPEDAATVVAGDRLVSLLDGQILKVRSVITKSADPREKLPLFDMGNYGVITHALVRWPHEGELDND